MTSNEAAGNGSACPIRLAPGAAVQTVPAGSAVPAALPMPRLGRGIVWSDIVAEIERDNPAQMRDAA